MPTSATASPALPHHRRYPITSDGGMATFHVRTNGSVETMRETVALPGGGTDEHVVSLEHEGRAYAQHFDGFERIVLPHYLESADFSGLNHGVALFADFRGGNETEEYLTGTANDDHRFISYRGENRLSGGRGDDVIRAGAGRDLIAGDAGEGVGRRAGASGVDTLRDVEHLIGSDYDDLFVVEGDMTVEARGGNDIVVSRNVATAGAPAEGTVVLSGDLTDYRFELQFGTAPQLRDTLGAAGTRRSRELVEEDGDVLLWLFDEDGALASHVFTDGSDTRSWHTTTSTYEDGRRSSIVRVEDDGDVGTTLFDENGKQVSYTLEDGSGTRDWTSRTYLYGQDGQIADTSYVWDDPLAA